MPFGHPEYLTDALRSPPYSGGIYVSDQRLLSDSDFEVLNVSAGSRDLHLIVKLTPAGAARMEREIQLGEQLATLVDSRLVSVAPLIGYLRTDVPIFMTLRMPRAAAESAAARLKARIPK